MDEQKVVSLPIKSAGKGKGLRAGVVMEPALTFEELSLAFDKVAANKGSPGIDGVSISDYRIKLADNLDALHTSWTAGNYLSQGYRTVRIEKSPGNYRKLAIPTVADRIIHTALASRLTEIFEPEFEHISFGYRPGRSYTHAIRKIEYLRDQGYSYVVDADIKGYFDTIPHNILRRVLKRYIPATWINTIFNVLLNHQLVANGLSFGEAQGLGVPQGSPLSPLLANLYLDSVDEALLDRGEQIIRYADDFVVLVNSAEQAQACLSFIHGQLNELGLALNEDKTRVVTFDEGFVFLGVSFIDNIIIPLKEQTEKALVSTGKAEFELADDSIDPARLAEDEALNAQIWHEHLPPELRQLQAAIFDDDTDLPIEPDSARIKRLSLNHVARLKLVYLHRQGAVVHKKGNRFNVYCNGELLSSLPANTLDAILCFGAVHLTQAVTRFCLENDIGVVWLSQSGQYIGQLTGPFQGDPKLCHAQVSSQQDLPIRLTLARYFVRSKINNCLGVIRRKSRKEVAPQSVIQSLIRLRKSLAECDALAAIRGVEGAAARCYFQWYRSQFASHWDFTSRNRQPPKDPINALLSYGYTLLFHNVQTLVSLRGLLPHLGYLHGDQPRQPSLVLDVMEAYRPWLIDELVLKLTEQGHITAEDFVRNEHACLLTKVGRRKFLTSLEQKFLSEQQHPTLKIKTDVRRMIDLQVLELRQQLLTGQWSLTPQRVR